MTFYREGKKLTYLEVIEMLNSLIKKDILTQLEEEEVAKLFLKVFDVTQEIITAYLEEIGYKVVDIRQSFQMLEQLKVVSDYETWDKVIELRDGIIAGVGKKNEIVNFIIQTLVGAMIDLNTKINKEVQYR